MSSDRNALFNAVLEGDLNRVELLLRSVSVDDADSTYGHTAAHVACAKNRVEILNLLLARGASMSKATTRDVPDGMIPSFLRV